MARYFDPSAFKAPVITPQNTFGNLPRNALFGPGTWTSSLALIKSFDVGRGMRAQFRAEAYNWLNHANLDNPVTNMSRGDFTQILPSRATGPCRWGCCFASEEGKLRARGQLGADDQRGVNTAKN